MREENQKNPIDALKAYDFETSKKIIAAFYKENLIPEIKRMSLDFFPQTRSSIWPRVSSGIWPFIASLVLFGISVGAYKIYQEMDEGDDTGIPLIMLMSGFAGVGCLVWALYNWTHFEFEDTESKVHLTESQVNTLNRLTRFLDATVVVSEASDEKSVEVKAVSLRPIEERKLKGHPSQPPELKVAIYQYLLAIQTALEQKMGQMQNATPSLYEVEAQKLVLEGVFEQEATFLPQEESERFFKSKMSWMTKIVEDHEQEKRQQSVANPKLYGTFSQII